MPQNIKRIWNIATTIFVVLVVLLAILLVGVRLIGIQPYTVLSGSMEPEIMTGSLVYVKPITPQEAQNLKAGDTVTYVIDSKGTKVTHKIYEVVGPAYVKNQYGEYVLDNNGQPTVAKDDAGNPIVMYTTYGVNNKNENSPTGYTLDGKLGVGNLGSSNIVGKPVFSIPLLGYVAHFTQNPPGKYVTIVFCVFLVAMTIFGGTPKKSAEDQTPAPKEATEGEPPTANTSPTANKPPAAQDDHTQ